MKLAWIFFLGALFILQLIGWQVFGRAQAVAAVAVIAYPSSILIGAYFCYLYYRDKTAIAALPLLLMVVQIQIAAAPYAAPRDALMTHAMSRFLEYEVTLFESYLASGVLLMIMFGIALLSAFITAEIGGRLTCQPHIRGKNLLRGAWQDFLRWEKSNVQTKADH